ncbi:MAG: tRNA (adenosine(37)-N6)-dimethylallyltransferase MiaA [Pseudomonadota bacterium]
MSVTLIAGATASGKSTYALERASRCDGVIINADSMQVYDALRVLTARPSPEDEAAVPHRLYGHVAASDTYSVARWVRDVMALVEQAKADGQPVFIVGGTGLYFRVLLEGLSPIPTIPQEVRDKWRSESVERPVEDLHRVLLERDPLAAERLQSTDTQRIVRALEVIDGTGKSLVSWQSEPTQPFIPPGDCECLLIERSREDLHRRCDARLEQMFAEGAPEEVLALQALQLEASHMIMRALGVRPLLSHSLGEISLDEALSRAQQETRQYVKRQATWHRRYMSSWKCIKT